MFQQIEIKSLIGSYDSINEVNSADQELLKISRSNLEKAYAPYSRFMVGAAIRLKNGTIVNGNNQENVAYPSGLCAERVAIFSCSAVYPGEVIETIAITARSLDFTVTTPVSPCGACRQVMTEYEKNQGTPIRVLLMGEKGPVYEIASVKELLPLLFEADSLRKE